MPSLILMGPPRAGSTLLAHVIDHHPQIVCTDEHRIFLVAARALAPLHAREGVEERFRPKFRMASRAIIFDHYYNLGATDQSWWGDKFPHYCDPAWGAEILERIDELFPRTRYIFLTRDREAVIQSMEKINEVQGWYGPDDIYDIYDRIHERANEWEGRVGARRFLRVTYEEGLRSSTDRILRFLDLPEAQELSDKICSEMKDPTRYSAPTSW